MGPYNTNVDRMSALLTFGILLAGGSAGLLAVLPWATDQITGAFSVEPLVAQGGISLALLGALALLARPTRAWVDRLWFPERQSLLQGFEQLLEDTAACAEPGELIRLVTLRVATLLRPRGAILYARDGATFEPALVHGSAQAAVSAGVVIPIRRGETLTAFVSIGPRSSGATYSASDATLLARVAERVSEELERFPLETVLEQERAMVETLRAEREEAERTNEAGSRLLAATHRVGSFVAALSDRVEEPGQREIVDKVRASTRALEDVFSALVEISQRERARSNPDVAPSEGEGPPREEAG
jgi:hypothetical protein